MQRSNSNARLDDSDSFSALSGSGADLSRYQEQLARERNSRTLNLRHLNRISIAGMLQNAGHQSVGARGLVDTNNFPFLDSSNFIETIRSNNISQVTQYTQNIASIAAHSPKKLNTLLNQDFIDFITNTFSNSPSDEMLIQIIRILEIIFPHCGLFQEKISEDIIFSFNDLFESNSQDVLLSVIGLISCMSSSSSSARDSFLAFGFYTNLIIIAGSQTSPELTRASCNALYSIFSNPDPIDNENLNDIAKDIVKLLSLDDKASVTYIIDCLVEMTNKYNQLLFTLFDCGIYPLSVEMLKDEELVGPTLRLVGNLSVAEPHEVNVLIESGLLPILNELLRTEHVADCFWVLSNLLERIPTELIPICDSDFVQEVIDIILSSNIDVQKEGSFFLCTLILLISTDILPQFMNQTIIDILVQTINCGVTYFILRCIDTLLKFLNYTQNNLDSSTVFFTALIGTDIRENLNELIEQETGLIVEKATYLLGLLDDIEKELNI